MKKLIVIVILSFVGCHYDPRDLPDGPAGSSDRPRTVHGLCSQLATALTETCSGDAGVELQHACDVCVPRNEPTNRLYDVIVECIAPAERGELCDASYEQMVARCGFIVGETECSALINEQDAGAASDGGAP